MIKESRSFVAYQEFILDTKLWWTRTLYPNLEQRYLEKVDSSARTGQSAPTDARAAEALMGDEPLYQFYAWLERHLQRFKYSGRHGLVPTHEMSRSTLIDKLNSVANDERLHLDADFKIPQYFSAVDIHQHPGGVWSDDLAGMVYERGARSTTPLLDKHADLHYRFTRHVLDKAAPTGVIDLGCGFGKSTQPFYTLAPQLPITGVDLAAPCLKLAALIAREDQAGSVNYRQGDAADTGLESASANTVTSTMLLHEMPPTHLRRVISETWRLLSPGGTAIHLDFLAPNDAFKRFIHYGHSRRNNEPYMQPLNELDLIEEHENAGFTQVEIIPFEEADGALKTGHRAWRFPWVMVIAKKPTQTPLP